MPKRSRMSVGLLTLAICLFTLYPPVELTRVIIINELILDAHPTIPSWEFVLELCLFWLGYVTGIVIVGWRIR